MINPRKKGVQTSIQTFNLRKASNAWLSPLKTDTDKINKKVLKMKKQTEYKNQYEVAGGDKSVCSGESGDGINTTP